MHFLKLKEKEQEEIWSMAGSQCHTSTSPLSREGKKTGSQILGLFKGKEISAGERWRFELPAFLEHGVGRDWLQVL